MDLQYHHLELSMINECLSFLIFIANSLHTDFIELSLSINWFTYEGATTYVICLTYNYQKNKQTIHGMYCFFCH